MTELQPLALVRWLHPWLSRFAKTLKSASEDCLQPGLGKCRNVNTTEYAAGMAAKARKKIYASCKFTEWAGFTEATFKERANFNWATFATSGSFFCATFLGRTLFTAGDDELGHTTPMFAGAEVDFRRAFIEPLDALIFRGSDLRKCLFLDTDLREAEFTNVTWPIISDEK
jgi:hypothetical protein